MVTLKVDSTRGIESARQRHFFEPFPTVEYFQVVTPKEVVQEW